MRALLVLTLSTVLAGTVAAQTTEFTYQGRLQDGSQPASGSFDFEFRLFAAASGGVPLATVQHPAVAVSAGLFTVALDFGAQFGGAARFLEVAARPAGAPSFTTIGPRQPITSSPHAVRSATAGAADALGPACSLCVTDGKIATVSGSKVTGTVPVTAIPGGSDHYVQNSPFLQAMASFNVSGSGRVGGLLRGFVVETDTQYNLVGSRVLSQPNSASLLVGRNAGAAVTTADSNTIVGVSAGAATTTGSANTYVGERAGAAGTNAFGNAFFGAAAGVNNTAGGNAFFGTSAGFSNTTGIANAFFGTHAGFDNTTAVRNSFFGTGAGSSNTTGNANAFFGFEAGFSSTVAGGLAFFGSEAGRSNTGLFNSFFGSNAGRANVDGNYNSYFGYWAGVVSTGEYNSFFGAQAGSSNTTGVANSFFGESAGEENTTGGRNTFIGRWAGNSNTIGSDNTMVGFNVGLLNDTGTDNVFVGLFAGATNEAGHHNTVIGSNADVGSASLLYATAIGADVEVTSSNTVAIGRNIDAVRVAGTLVVGTLGVGGATALCRNPSQQLAICSSSARYKHDVAGLRAGLDVVARLRPVTFRWNADGAADVGFVAEEVAAVEPLLTTRNADGEIEGVKYGQVSAVLVRAVQEQQRQIEDQRRQIEALRAVVCADRPDAPACAR